MSFLPEIVHMRLQHKENLIRDKYSSTYGVLKRIYPLLKYNSDLYQTFILTLWMHRFSQYQNIVAELESQCGIRISNNDAQYLVEYLLLRSRDAHFSLDDIGWLTPPTNRDYLQWSSQLKHLSLLEKTPRHKELLRLSTMPCHRGTIKVAKKTNFSDPNSIILSGDLNMCNIAHTKSTHSQDGITASTAQSLCKSPFIFPPSPLLKKQMSIS
jgi:hypothetical protein